MDGAGITIDAAGLDAAIQRLRPLLTFDGDEQLMSDIGQRGQLQTQQRILEEKAGPDGEAWPPNREGTPTLFRTGAHLFDQIAFFAGATEVEWGSSWEFAHIHQFGATITPKSAKVLSFMLGGRRVAAKKVTIPARPFVGLSDENGREILELVTDFLARRVA